MQRFLKLKKTYFRFCTQREELEYDVLIVGGGPAGLSTAIKLKQLAKETNNEITVCLIEKGSEIGSHIISGNVFDPRYFNQLFPHWKELEIKPPLFQKVVQDKFYYLIDQDKHVDLSFGIPKALHNHNNYIISLSNLTKWMAEQAEMLGVDIFTSTAGNSVIYENDKVIGITTKEMGISKQGEKKENYMDGMDLLAYHTVISEGAAGSLAKQIIDKYQLNKNRDPQTFGLGFKEIWESSDPNFLPGIVQHSMGFPLDNNTYGGSFLYTQKEGDKQLIHLGLIIGLDYRNPYLNLYKEFQKFKTHKQVRKYLEGQKCISYGARVINSGGLYTIPEASFPGGVLTGCSAGFLDFNRIKGAHNAIGSGIIAANNAYGLIVELDENKYSQEIKQSQIYKDLNDCKNSKNFFKKYGTLGGLAINGIAQYVPYLRNMKTQNTIKDCVYNAKEQHQEIKYDKPDGKLTFELLENLTRSNTYHDHDQPSHLKIKKGLEMVIQLYQQKSQESLQKYEGPEQRFCPAGVYEFVDNDGKKKLQINAQNCIHCKTCDIKMVDEYIDWTVPEGSGGPNYSGM